MADSANRISNKAIEMMDMSNIPCSAECDARCTATAFYWCRKAWDKAVIMWAIKEATR